MADPTRAEALQWLALTGRSQGECIDELWPQMPDAERRRVEARLRQWVRRARTGEVATRTGPPPAAQVSGPTSAAAPPPRVPPPNRPPDPTPPPDDESRIDALRRQLRSLEEDVAAARATAQLRLVPQLDKRVSEVRADLDRELERERRVVRLPRTPTAICARLREVAPAVALRAEMHRRAAERAARDDE